MGDEPRKRPSRLLRKKPADPATRVISAGNSTDSPFLRLPPELRNRIYRLALGDRAIHVFSARWRTGFNPQVSFCKRAETGMASVVQEHNSTAVIRIVDPEYIPLHSEYDELHDECLCNSHVEAAPVSQATDLLLVCRQVHQEAALIPFASNHFCFHCIPSLQWFVKILAPSQIRAVCSITISVPSDTGTILTRSALKYFTVIGFLAVNFEIEEILPAYSVSLLEHTVSRFGRDWNYLKLANLKILNAPKVKVTPVLRRLERARSQRSTTEALTGWAQAKEAELLQGN